MGLSHLHPAYLGWSIVYQLGTYNTIKAVLPELKKTKGSLIAISATLQEGGEGVSLGLWKSRSWPAIIDSLSNRVVTLYSYPSTSACCFGEGWR